MENFLYDEKQKKFYLPDNSISFENLFEAQKSKGCEEIYYYNKQPIFISNSSKVIKFICDDGEYNIFITNREQVFFLIGFFKFDKYLIYKDNEEKQYILDSLDFNIIKKVKNFLKEKEFLEANKNFDDDNNVPLNSLSILYDKYQKYDINSKTFDLTNERNDFFKSLIQLLSNKNFLLICGPKSIGKTTSLLYFMKKHYLRKYFYINLSYCKKLLMQKEEEENLNLAICKELFNCLTFEDVNKIYSELSLKKFDSVMELLLELIKNLAQAFPSTIIYIVIDQYKEKIDKNNVIIGKIKYFLNKAKNFSAIICNSLNEKDFRKALQLYLKNKNDFFMDYLFINKLATVPEKYIKELKEEEQDLLLKCGNLYKYYYEIIKNKNDITIEEIEQKIKAEITEEINGYYSNNDTKEIMDFIRKIHLNINKPLAFDDLKNMLYLFPLKYFYINVNQKSLFKITEINNESSIIINFSYPIVIETINDIFYLKKDEKINLINNFDVQKEAIELEENFNDFLWMSRFNYFYYDCNIKERISISSIIKMKKKDKEIYENALANLKNKNDSILITQYEPNAAYFDTGILKFLDKEKNLYELYLFQETIHKHSDERLCEIFLNTLKHFLKLLYKYNLNIEIEDVCFGYVFKGENPDQQTKNYCQENQINYMEYYESKRKLIISDINNKIESVFHYLRFPRDMTKNTIKLKSLDIYYKKKINIEEEYNKLNVFLQKKRDRKKSILEKIDKDIKKACNFDNLDFRKNNYKELLLNEELMENNNSIIGVSYQVDSNTKQLLQKINMSQTEKKNLFNLVKDFGNELSILSVIQIDNLSFNWKPSFRCAILEVDENNNKYYYDTSQKKLYSLQTKKEKTNLSIESTFYMIIFVNSKLIV